MEWWVWVVLVVVVFFLVRAWSASRRARLNGLERMHLNTASALSHAKQEYEDVVRRYEAGGLSSYALQRHLDSIFSYASAVHLGIHTNGGVDDGYGEAAIREITEMLETVGNMMMQREHEEWGEKEGLR